MTDDVVKPNAFIKPDDACVVPPDRPIPAELLGRYSVERDAFAEQDIADYVHSQARDEVVNHVERVKREVVMGEPYEIWDVTTDQGRWWVITNPTNLYSQQHFASLDYTFSFHVGLMARVRSRSVSPDGNDPTPFDEVLRRFEQARDRFGHAIEVEDLQAIGMLLREGLISLTTAVHRRVVLPQGVEVPQVANFVAWTDVLLNVLCAGGSNERLRQYLKSQAKETWQLVNWLTHSRSADRIATEIAVDGSDVTLRTFIQLLERQRTGGAEECPSCHSRNIRTFFDIDIPPDGDYFLSCGACDWHNHPGVPADTNGEEAQDMQS
ncbi:hypothetical protein M2165_003369 [Variovorax sp. TBS-050B]|uniref:hypothetical protein n=1 Tax=Variovorax sp. TBS-050B TaxID=2940551 RepID=UPI0024760878|nr:hypothetical protein [Variovorax sp. TBS-050B]MDH6593480.1 hypothetical protein [Variovorax sp. TBS-050B]